MVPTDGLQNKEYRKVHLCIYSQPSGRYMYRWICEEFRIWKYLPTSAIVFQPGIAGFLHLSTWGSENDSCAGFKSVKHFFLR